jgi:hypothetical protein
MLTGAAREMAAMHWDINQRLAAHGKPEIAGGSASNQLRHVPPRFGGPARAAAVNRLCR